MEREQAQCINISKHSLRPTSMNLNINTYNYTYINLNIKCSVPPHIDTYMHIPMHVSGLLLSLWGPLIPFLYATNMSCPQECRLRRKVEACKTYHLTPQLAANIKCVWFIGNLLHTYDKDTTVYINSNFLWSKRNLYIKYFDTSDADLSFILGSNS